MFPSGDTIVSERDHPVIRFAAIQLFVLIYLEKLGSGPVSLGIVLITAHLAWMLVARQLTVSRTRLGLYLAMGGFCIFSEALTFGSILSVTELLVVCSFFTVEAEITEASYRRILAIFINLMIVPALIVLVQYGYQRLTGRGDPIDMNNLLPKSVLLQGYIYDAHHPWYSSFSRPNGFFLLEPSVASMLTASAAIIEVTYFRRLSIITLMVSATFLSLGGTGIAMLLVALPFLLARESARLASVSAILGIVTLVVAVSAGTELPLVSRMSELHQQGSSGSGRLLLPSLSIVTYATDPAYFFLGAGAGSITGADGAAWPLLKLIKEYGLLAALMFAALYLTACGGRFNLALKVSLSIIFNFVSGSLLSPHGIPCLMLLFTLYRPVALNLHPQAPRSGTWWPRQSGSPALCVDHAARRTRRRSKSKLA
jgi:hypothetical protein